MIYKCNREQFPKNADAVLCCLECKNLYGIFYNLKNNMHCPFCGDEGMKKFIGRGGSPEVTGGMDMLDFIKSHA